MEGRRGERLNLKEIAGMCRSSFVYVHFKVMKLESTIVVCVVSVSRHFCKDDISYSHLLPVHTVDAVVQG